MCGPEAQPALSLYDSTIELVYLPFVAPLFSIVECLVSIPVPDISQKLSNLWLVFF